VVTGPSISWGSHHILLGFDAPDWQGMGVNESALVLSQTATS